LRNRWLCVLVFLAVLVGRGVAQSDEKLSSPRFNFNAGTGYGVGRGDAGSFVGSSPFNFAVGSAGLNLSRLFGFSGEYMYYDLTPRRSVSDGQNLGNASGALHVASLNGIVRPPISLGGYRVYGIFGVGFYDRRVDSNTGMIHAGAICQPAWIWWDIACYFNPTDGLYHTRTAQTMLSNSKIAGGYNFGGGITYPLNHWHNAKVYAEFRYHKAYQSDVQTIVWPVTVGLRW